MRLSPRRLAAALRRFFLKQRAEVLAAVKAGRQPAGLLKWTAPMVEALSPIVAPWVVQGAVAAAKRIKRKVNRAKALPDLQPGVGPGQVGGRHGEGGDQGARLPHQRRAIARLAARSGVVDRRIVRKDALGDLLAVAFDLFNPEVREAVRRLTFDFCDETNRTSQRELNEALTDLRGSLGEGLEEGEALKTLSGRVGKIFADPQRALTIAATESSRATHGGQLLAAEASGVVGGLRWLVSADACPRCKELDGKVVRLGEDFVVLPGKAAYSRVKNAPLHPRCQCTTTEILVWEMPE